MANINNLQTIYQLQSKIKTALFDSGWIVSTRHRQNPDGVLVYGRRGRSNLAIGVPRDNITLEELTTWNRGLCSLGIRCLWLLPFRAFPVTKDLPAVSLQWMSGEYAVRIPSGDTGQLSGVLAQLSWPQTLALDKFLRCALNGQFWFGVVRSGTSCLVRLDGGMSKCPACGCWVNLCCALEVFSSYPESSFAFYRIGDIPCTLTQVLAKINTRSLKLGPLVSTKIDSQAHSATYNSCFNCHALIPHSYILELSGRESSIAQFPIEVDKVLATTMETLPQARWRLSVDLKPS